ncbi:hypothetical protein ABZW11_36425 [Nonomuraea sp. NPDC004580]
MAHRLTVTSELRTGTDLYRRPLGRYADPALRFRADARIVDWSS